MEADFLSPRTRMRPIFEEIENGSNTTTSPFTFPDAQTKYDAKSILHSIRSFLATFKSSPTNSSVLSLLLYIKQLNESVSDLLCYQTFTQNDTDCDVILAHLQQFNQNIISYLNNRQHPQQEPHPSPPVYANAILGTATAARPPPPSVTIDPEPHVLQTSQETERVEELDHIARSPRSNETNDASEGKEKESELDKARAKQQKRRKREMEKRLREEIKRRNIDDNFNFYESYNVLKQETNYRLHSQQHYSGKLGLKNISRLQLLRLISNIITRAPHDEMGPIDQTQLTSILRSVFRSKLNGKKFQNLSHVRFRQMLALSPPLEKQYNVSFKIYNAIKMYFEKSRMNRSSRVRVGGMSPEDIEHYYQGRLYIDRKFCIMDEILYGKHEYEQMFQIDEKATEDEIYDAQNYGSIYRIKSSNPALLFKKIELECFDDLQSVLNEQYGLKIFDENCQLYFGSECDYNSDGEEIEYISSRLIMTEYKGSTLAEKIYDYAEENDYLTEYDIGGILYKILIAMQATHRKNVIHCDLKPDNMIINIHPNTDPNAQQKSISINLIDFGYCEIVKGHDFVIQKHLIKGTKGYIAPEIFSEYKYSKRSDIYSIGCIGFEMITGGTLPSDYDQNGNYCEEASNDESDSDDDAEQTVLDIDIEKVLNAENRKRAFDNRISHKLIKFITKLLEYEYHERYDISNAVIVARKNWSMMKPKHKNRTAFF
eukprot:96922_1